MEEKKTLKIINTNVPFIINLSIINIDQTVFKTKSFDTRFDIDKIKEWLCYIQLLN